MAAAKKTFIWGLGRRKTSVARVRIAPGEGKVLINKREVKQYFTIERRQSEVLKPLEIAEVVGKYDVFINVQGGGDTGQAGACVLGISRALIKADPTLEAKLRPYGLLTRDSRMVERKKYGLRGARRGCQFSKR